MKHKWESHTSKRGRFTRTVRIKCSDLTVWAGTISGRAREESGISGRELQNKCVYCCWFVIFVCSIQKAIWNIAVLTITCCKLCSTFHVLLIHRGRVPQTSPTSRMVDVINNLLNTIKLLMMGVSINWNHSIVRYNHCSADWWNGIWCEGAIGREI